METTQVDSLLSLVKQYQAGEMPLIIRMAASEDTGNSFQSLIDVVGTVTPESEPKARTVIQSLLDSGYSLL